VPRLFKFFGYCWTKLWLLGVIMLITVALGVSALRASLPYITQYNQEFSQYLSDNYQVDLTLSSMTGQWLNGGPEIIISDLKFNNMAKFGVDFTADKLKFSLDFHASLMALAPRFSVVELINPKVTLGQLPKTQSTASDPVPDLFNVITKLVVEDASIEFEPGTYGEMPSIGLKRLQWLNNLNRHQLTLSLAPLPGGESDPLSLVADFYGDNSNNIDGQFYLKATKWQWLDNLRPLLAALNPTASAQASFELWGDFSEQGLTSAFMAVADNYIRWDQGGHQQQLSLKPGDLQWQQKLQGWQLTGHKLKITTNLIEWPSINLLLSQHQGQLSLSLDKLALANLVALRGLASALTPATDKLLTQLQPDAKLTEFSWWQQNNMWHYQGLIKDYNQQRSGLLPQMSQLDAFITGNELGGQAEIAMAQQALDFGETFAEPLPLTRLNSTLQWAVDGDRWWLFDKNLLLETADIKSHLSWQLAFENNESPILSLAGNAQLLAAEKTWRYLPRGALSKGLIDYLNAGIKGGSSTDVKLLWQGALNNYPYRDHSGIFAVDATLTDAEFVYDPNWPRLSDATLTLQFKNEGLLITGLAGRVEQLKFSQLSAQIPDLTQKPSLAVNFSLTDKVGPIADVIKQSPLKSTVGAALKQLGVGGKVAAKIEIDIPFDGSEPVTKGQLSLSGNEIVLKALDLPLQNITGQLDFVNGNITGQNLSAVMYQQPFKFDILTKTNGANYQLDLDLAANWDTTKMPEQWHGYLDDYLVGTLDWQGKVNLNITPDNVLYQAKINSPLIGMKIKLPQPLSKSTKPAQALVVNVAGDNAGGEFKLALGAQADVLAQYQLSPQGLKVNSMALHVGRRDSHNNSSLVTDELGLQVNVAYLDIDKWQSFITNLKSGRTSSNLLPPLSHLNIKVKELAWLGQNLSDVSLQGIKRQDFWQISLHSKQAKGQIKLYDDQLADGVTANFEYLKLTSNNTNNSNNNEVSSAQAATKPTTLAELLALPLLTFTCQSCQIGEVDLGKVSFNTGRNEQGISIENLLLEAPSTRLSLAGAWGVDEQGEFSTLSGTLASNNVVESLKLINFSSSIKDSDAKVDFKLNWRGNIYSPALESMAGNVKWHLGEGHISEVSDQGARIFTLFSLDSLRRKLVLDFRDVFVKGLFFNNFDGSFEINDGIAVTHDTYMDGLAGDLDVLGSINLATHDLDYYLTFTPRLFSNLPVVAGVVTSAPQVFVVAFALTKVLGPIVDVVSQVNFKLTGTVDQPKFVEVNRKKKKYKVPSHMIVKSKAAPLIGPGGSE